MLLTEILSVDQPECRNDCTDVTLSKPGVIRLKCFKGDFGKSDSNDWSTYTPEMLDYCIQDTEVTIKLYGQLITTTYGGLLMTTSTPKKSDPLTH